MVTPQHFIRRPCQFASTQLYSGEEGDSTHLYSWVEGDSAHLYSWVERGTWSVFPKKSTQWPDQVSNPDHSIQSSAHYPLGHCVLDQCNSPPPLLGSVILNDPTPVPIIGIQFPIVLPHTLLAMTDLPSFPPGNNEILPQKNLPPPSLLSLTKKG